MNHYGSLKKQPKLNDNRKVDEVLCPEGYKAMFVCISKNCYFSAFACAQQHCKCEQIHQNCLTVKTNQILKKLCSKINAYQPLIDDNNRMIQEKINQFQQGIIKLRQKKDKLYYKLLKKLQFAGMNELQKTIYEKLVTKKTDDIKGLDISMIQATLEEETSTAIEKQMKFLRQFWSIQIQTINQLKQAMKKIQFNFQGKQKQDNIQKKVQRNSKMQKMQEKKVYQKQLLFNPYQIQQDQKMEDQNQKYSLKYNISEDQYQKYFLKYNISDFKKSSVVKSKEEKTFLFSLFQDKKDVSFQLLFKASQNYFNVENFKQVCAGIPHTLTLIKTNKNIKVGGYTQLSWENTQKRIDADNNIRIVNNIQVDSKQQTFLFSITDQVKLKAKQNVGICNQPSYGPCFIAYFENEDKSLQYEVCLAIQGNQQWVPIQEMNVALGFQNQNYDSRRFLGKKIKDDFRPKQWQVWKVNFKEQIINSKQIFSNPRSKMV